MDICTGSEHELAGPPLRYAAFLDKLTRTLWLEDSNFFSSLLVYVLEKKKIKQGEHLSCASLTVRIMEGVFSGKEGGRLFWIVVNVTRLFFDQSTPSFFLVPLI